MKEYTIEIHYTYIGHVTVKAENKRQAIEYVEKHCGHVDSRGFHTVLDDETIIDWEFDCHPEAKLVSIS